jgi:flagellar hook protein FlgE
MWIGTTGLAGSERQLDVIANNLANSNTPGFKASDTYFTTMLSQNLAGGSQQSVGQGVSISAINTIFDQGSSESTGNSTDVSIDGNGFFVVEDADGKAYYTRSGGFYVDNEGYLRDNNGYRVQGHMFDSAGIVENTALTDLDLRNVQSVPKASEIFSLGLILDSQTEVGTTFDVTQVLYDSRGAEHTLTTTFTKLAGNSQWSVVQKLDGGLTAVPPGYDALSQDIKGIEFGPDGSISKTFSDDTCTTLIGDNDPLSATPDIVDSAVSFYAPGGALADGATVGVDGVLTWNIVDSATDTGDKALSIRSFATTSRINSLAIDGYPSGIVTSLDVGQNGVIEGRFSNGQRQDIARLMLADFPSLQGLSKVGSYFIETNESGPVVINKPNTGGLGAVQSHSLEMSNTDTGREFIKMIMAQRAYQASAKVITTADQMTQVLMNVKQ